MSDGSGTKLWTPANVITLLRICLVPIFVVALLSPWPEWFGVLHVVTDQMKALVAAGVFVLISCTDWVDGYLARSRNEVTDFGKFLDPLADKILVAAALIALVELRVIPSWPVLIILTREFIVSGIRMIAATKGVVIAASWYGKAKTVLQIVAIVMFLIKDSLYLPNLTSAIENPLYVASWIVMIAALVMTVLSMLDYIAKARPLLFGSSNEIVRPAEQDSCPADKSLVLPPDDHDLLVSKASNVVRLASDRELKLATAESLTGGLIAASITAISGSSAIFNGACVTYVNEAKHHLLGVGSLLLEKEGAVCEEVAIEMAKGAAEKLEADVAVAVTGIAGPTGAEPGKPVGTVWIAIFASGIEKAVCKHFEGDREAVRAQTAAFALDLFESELSSD